MKCTILNEANGKPSEISALIRLALSVLNRNYQSFKIAFIKLFSSCNKNNGRETQERASQRRPAKSSQGLNRNC